MQDRAQGTTLQFVGWLIALVGAVGTLIVVVAMGESPDEYTSVSKWLAGFGGLTVVALGAIAVGVGQLVAKDH